MSLILFCLLPILAFSNTVTIDWKLSSQPYFEAIQPGDTIKWVWGDSHPHSVTPVAHTEFADSGIQSPPFTYSHTFQHEGLFGFHCLVHSQMAGAILVSAITISPSPSPIRVPTNSPVPTTQNPTQNPVMTTTNPTKGPTTITINPTKNPTKKPSTGLINIPSFFVLVASLFTIIIFM